LLLPAQMCQRLLTFACIWAAQFPLNVTHIIMFNLFITFSSVKPSEKNSICVRLQTLSLECNWGDRIINRSFYLHIKCHRGKSQCRKAEEEMVKGNGCGESPRTGMDRLKVTQREWMRPESLLLFLFYYEQISRYTT
jgi:hypothetical protein